MNKFIKVSLFRHVVLNGLLSPDRPVVTCELHFKFVTKEVNGFVDLIRPGQGIPDLRAPGCVNVVQVM